MVNIYLFTLVLLHYGGVSYETVSGVYGDTITLTCRYNDRDQTINSNQIYWRKVDNIQDSSYHRNCGVTFFIYYAKLQDQGLYACYYNERMLYGVEVVVKPDINMNLLNTREIPKIKEVFASPDEIVEITCEADFEIDPFAVIWRKSSGPLDLQYHFPRGSRLYLYHVKPQDSGDYSCFFYGYELTRTKLYISGQYIPGPQTTQRPITFRPPEPELQTLRFNLNDNIELVCRISSDIDPSSITWQRIGGELDTYYHRQYADKLFLYYAKLEDSGVYACYYGNNELYRVRVDVIGEIVTQPPTQTYRPTEPPQPDGSQKPFRVIVTSGPIRVREGDAFEISCRVDGSLPGLKSLLFKDQSYLGEEQGNAVYLRVPSARRSDEGRYLCYGFNEDRSLYEIETVDVIIEGRSSDSDYDFNTGNSASSTSAPYIILTLDTEEINQEGYEGEAKKVCTAKTHYLSAPLTVDWYDSNNVLVDENYIKGFSVEKTVENATDSVTIHATLVLKNIEPPETGLGPSYNGGYYECRASLNGYTESKNFYFRAYTTHQIISASPTDPFSTDDSATEEPITEEPITEEQTPTSSQEITEEVTDNEGFTFPVY